MPFSKLKKTSEVIEAAAATKTAVNLLQMVQ